ncbi:Crp/Fnr family transcriptional regulator [Lacticaseibacillus jixiensis]|uniref:Crp/Fnr family transcriptional regulator n=1 Tax=Lacticaseibacillus jixiensis TaxID=3231926 RepID=UPI0036F2BFBC
MAITDQHQHPAHDLCVATVPIFNRLPHAQLEQVEALVHHEHIPAGTPLYLPDSKADALYILHHGQVKIARVSADGREQLLRLLGPGDFDGDAAMFADQTHTAEARATTPVVACVLYKHDFQALLKTYPEVSMAVIQALASRVDELETQTTLATTADVAARLRHYLRTQLAEQGAHITLPMKKKDLADYLGTTPETLSRKLTLLEDAGVILQGRGKVIEILDPSRLD